MECATGRQVGSVVCCNGLSQNLMTQFSTIQKHYTENKLGYSGKNAMIYHVHPRTVEDSPSSCWGSPCFVLPGAQEEHIGYCDAEVGPHLDRLARDAGPARRVPGALTTAYGDAAGTSASPSPNASGNRYMKYLKFISPKIQLQILSSFLNFFLL